ncbi:hypothetical protein [Prosthecobacter sp.]|uniref:hypothetical protein n=1 Tax=Prosthecobacter sp. TaxID=1965333 RepID=UPI003783918D
MSVDIETLNSSLRGLIDRIGKFPSVSAPNIDISERFDATAHSKTKDAKSSLDALATRLKKLGEFDSNSEVPSAIVSKINKLIKSVQNILDEIERNIRKPQGNETVQRVGDEWYTELTARIQHCEGELLQILLPWKQVANADIVTSLEAASQKAKDTESKLAHVEDTALRVQKQLEERTREAAATVLSEANLKEIDESILTHEQSARQWLIAFGCAGLLALRLMIWIFSEGDNLAWPFPCLVQFRAAPVDPTLAQALMSSIGKIIVASFGFGLLVLTSRVYQTHSHNAIVNRHRRAAFVSYQRLYTIIKDDEDSRKIVVQQAAAAIFGHTATGFLQKGSSEFAMGSLMIQEALKAVRPSKGLLPE